MSLPAAPASDPSTDAPPTSDATEGTHVPHHAHAAVARIVDAIEQDGVVVTNDTDLGDVETILAMTAPLPGDMDGDVSHVDWLIGPNPEQPLHGSWKIVWSNGNETTVTIDHDGDATAMDATGNRWRRVGSNGLSIVTVRHVRRIVGGDVASLSAVVDVDRLALPEDEPDGRRPVHVARTIARLVVLAATRLLDPAGRYASLGLHVPPLPKERGGRYDGQANDLGLAYIVAFATILDAGREDVLEQPSDAAPTRFSLRRPSALAPGLCHVDGQGTDRIAYEKPEAIPPQSIRLEGGGHVEEGGVPYVFAYLTTPTTGDDLGGRDAVQNIRLCRLAEAWRARPEADR